MQDVAPSQPDERSGRTPPSAAKPWSLLQLSLAVSVFALFAFAAIAAFQTTSATPNRAATPDVIARIEGGPKAAVAALELAVAQATAIEAADATRRVATPPEASQPPEAFSAFALPSIASAAVTSPIAAASEAPARSATATASTAAAETAPSSTPTAAPTAAPAVAQQPGAPAPAAAVAISGRERGLLDAMNRERVANGLSALTSSAALLPIARERSRDMVTNSYFAHFAPNGDSVYTLVAAAGLRFSAVGENLARVSGDEARSVAVAIEKLMASPPHRANILSPHFSHVAVGAVTDADGVTVFTSVFSGG